MYCDIDWSNVILLSRTLAVLDLIMRPGAFPSYFAATSSSFHIDDTKILKRKEKYEVVTHSSR